ncbi:hypothetical protein ASPWEDRAFT_177937 [Aspergillus wentii DTO 134E9]|uniref:Carbonic anhydrase n=1 Tax=Aspergillus wentii DTO 134E9 TaxID=1073089 RepID=A0A1L9RYI8_ASPWE|nr:uncharacterized protein ASPWEDRAFT_177937 [Aspergillus wentii DTO 134E9]KAI9932463.1 hypothetical protein MW887_008704 [Aspergillus wentii]OJJ40030.1 hypothetical protein ASPWEDRAFT_177937 [Aspergillus wentii DTO 134E9]
MSQIDTLLDQNKEYVPTHQSPPPITGPEGARVPSPQTIIITCADPRVVPERFLRLEMPNTTSPTYPVVRVIGGRANRATVDILGLEALFGLDHIMIIHHTDCGLMHTTDEEIRTGLKPKFPGHQNLEGMKFGEIKDLKQSVVDDMNFLRRSPLIRKDIDIRGFIYGIEDGTLNEVTA